MNGPESIYYAHEVFASSTVQAYAFAGDLDAVDEHPPHTHDFIEIVVVAEGHGVHLGSNGVTELEPGTVVVVRPGAWHRLGERSGLIGAAVGISPTALASELSFLRMRARTRDLLYAGPAPVPARGIWVTSIAPDLAREIVEETGALQRLVGDHPEGGLRILGRLIAILGTLAEGLSTRARPTHPAVLSVLDRFEATLQRDWRIAELADLVNLEKTYFIRLFGAQVGMPPVAYLGHLRADRAATLLATTDLPISTIGTTVGWSDPAYFARRFRAHLGSSPRDYRRRLRTSSAHD